MRDEQLTSALTIPEGTGVSKREDKASWPLFSGSQLPALVDAFSSFDEYLEGNMQTNPESHIGPDSAESVEMQDAKSEASGSKQWMAMDLSPDVYGS